MGLRFMLLLTMRLAAWLRLSQREETWKTAEILILRATSSQSCSSGSRVART